VVSGVILCGSGDVEDDIDSILLNQVAPTIPKWRTFKLLRWAQELNRLMDLKGISYRGDYIEDDVDSILLYPVASTIPNGGITSEVGTTFEPIGGFE
jgi:hypothetical protein